MLANSKGKTTASRSKGSLTPKGARTRRALLDCGRRVFEAEGYFAASISEIGRQCGVSQGTFYQYFRNKEQVFREIVDDVLAGFWEGAQASLENGGDFPATFRRVLGHVLRHCRENAALHRVMNEFELIETVSISYYDSIARFCRTFFRRAAQSGHLKPLDPNVAAYSLIGLAIFLQRDWGPWKNALKQTDPAELTADLLERGISGPSAWKPPRKIDLLGNGDGQPGVLQWEEDGSAAGRTRRAIFQAAEQVLGENGYNRAGIAEITRRAGVAQGTFYIHFKSKEDLMKGVVHFLSHELRRELRRSTELTEDRRDQEIQGMLAFFHFLGLHSPIYRIVSESEVIVPEAAEYYYGKLAFGYSATLSEGMRADQIRNLPIEFLVPALMGINHMIGLRWLVWSTEALPEIPRQLLEDAVELVLFGLIPR